MRSRPFFWFCVSVLCMVAAWYSWQWGNRRATGPDAVPPDTTAPASGASVRSATPFALTSTASATNANVSANPAAAARTHRVSNTPQAPDQLVRNDRAVLLENAVVDTTRPLTLAIPDHLRAAADPGAYIVQASRPLDRAFRQELENAGARIISYIPNNAYLVRAEAAASAALATSSSVAVVLPYEPYYKLRAGLLAAAVEQTPLPDDAHLNLVLFADVADATRTALDELGATVVLNDQSPFGPVVRVRPGPAALTSLAGLPGVQMLEFASVRVPANDLIRTRLGVNTTGDAGGTNNHLGLTGAGVRVNVTDTGVDAEHPDLVGRVTGFGPRSLLDTIGHGTHVAATIAGDGTASATLSSSNMPPGSLTNANFRGMAPEAEIFSLFTDLTTGPRFTDAFLQETAANTNALISNNSWHYRDANSYDLAAANYDAAVRDTLPGVTGAQPVLFVFAAGNAGFGDSGGLGGFAETIQSPATAKNVITVGALEQARNITNEIIFNCVTNDPVIVTNNGVVTTNITITCETNAPFAALTDSAFEVASYSSRGNVGIGIEGEFGRVKPDLMAPGTFVVSARSRLLNTNAFYNPVDRSVSLLEGIEIQPGNPYINLVPPLSENTLSFSITVITNNSLPQPFPAVPIYLKADDLPTDADLAGFNRVNILNPDPAVSFWSYGVGNNHTQTITVDILVEVVTRRGDPLEEELFREINERIGPYYMYRSGTSMAAAGVSGVAALMQQFFLEQFGVVNSPALTKALLINGARSAGPSYSLSPLADVNHQGWGAVNLPNTLPLNGVTNLFRPELPGSLKVFEQNSTNALGTGYSQTRILTLNTNTQEFPLRITLVWTDPPGNPTAAIKLVNDLDLTVTNLASGEVYFGNAIAPGNNFTSPWDTNNPILLDGVNNVENVYLPSPLGSNYSVTVSARRVNVGALPQHPDDLVQDYVLVISSGNSQLAGDLTVSTSPLLVQPKLSVFYVTNTFSSSNASGFFLEDQRVAANPPLLGDTNGLAPQWQFYVVTNTTSFTNAAFAVEESVNLALPRIGVRAENLANATRAQADIDLYVSTDPGLTNLASAVVAGAFKSTRRGGSELVILSNAVPNAVYYIGVKSEDQMAAEFRFSGVFSLNPFGEGDYVECFTFPVEIPDGTASNPGGVYVWCPCGDNEGYVRRVVVTNILAHELLGDTLGFLEFNGTFTFLNNHRGAPETPAVPGPYGFIYEDNEEISTAPPDFYLLPSDGPGSLRNYVGQLRGGNWNFYIVDNQSSSTGLVLEVGLLVERQENLEEFTPFEIEPFSWRYYFVEVPAGATNLTVTIISNNVPIELYLRRGDFPSRLVYDHFKLIEPPGDSLSVGLFDFPPLLAGRYYIGLFNPNPVTAGGFISVRVEVDRSLLLPDNYAGAGIPILDDAVTTATQLVTNRGTIAAVEVGLRVEHPRISDLAFTLISPSGTRVLLMENRGRTSDAGAGSTLSFTNIVPVSSAGGPEASTNRLEIGLNSGTLVVDYEFFPVPDRMTIYYDGNRIYDSGLISGSGSFEVDFGPGISSEVLLVMNEGGNNQTNTLWEYTVTVVQNLHNYLVFTEDTNRAPVPIKFALPPFYSAQLLATNYVVSDFDAEPVGIVAAPGPVDGWDVLTNQVSVFDDPVLVHAGSNSLALQDGVITRGLPTTPRQRYALSHAYWQDVGLEGLVSWWRAENNGRDSVGTNHGSLQGPVAFADGMVGQAFSFDSSGNHVAVPPSASLDVGRGSGFTIEAWIAPTNVSIGRPIVEWVMPGDYGVHFLTWNNGALYANIVDTNSNWHILQSAPGLLVTNEFAHVAVTYDQASGVGRLLLNGAIVAEQTFVSFTPRTSTNLLIGFRPASSPLGPLPFLGLIDEVSLYGRALAASEIAAIYAAGTNGKCSLLTPPAVCAPDLLGAHVVLEGISTNWVTGTGGWRTNTYFFTARATNTVVTITPVDGDSGLLLDSFVLAEQGDQVYVLPEETLAAFEGESAQGLWTLEIWDSRAGGMIPTPRLMSWELSFIYQDLSTVQLPLPPIITLTNGIPYTNTTFPVPGAAQYYRYVVTNIPPARVQFEINHPTDDLTLVARKGPIPPVPALDVFDYRSANIYTNDELIVVITNSTPVPLTAGEWFLAAINSSGVAVDYAIKATEWPVTGRPINILSVDVSTNGFCITWESLPGVHYFIEGTPTLNPVLWELASATITANDTNTTYCVPLPSPLHFFRVVEGLALNPYAPPTRIVGITTGPNGVLLEWFGPVAARYRVEWSPTLTPPDWTAFTETVTSPDTYYFYQDDGSQTGGFDSTRFYRLIQLP